MARAVSSSTPAIPTMIKIEADAFDAAENAANRRTMSEQDELDDTKTVVKREATPAALDDEASPKKKAKTTGGSPRKLKAANGNDTGGNDGRRERAGGTGKRWSAAELDALLSAAVKGANTRAFEGAVPGRTSQQCYMTWRNTVLPRLRRALGAADNAAGAE